MPSRMLFNLFGIIAVDHRSESRHQPGAIIQHAFCRSIAADALRAGLRAERAAAVTRGRAIAGDALLQQAQVGINYGSMSWMRTNFLIGLLHCVCAGSHRILSIRRRRSTGLWAAGWLHRAAPGSPGRSQRRFGAIRAGSQACSNPHPRPVRAF